MKLFEILSISGGSAGMCQIVVTTPMELLKIQLQDAGKPNDCCVETWEQDLAWERVLSCAEFK